MPAILGGYFLVDILVMGVTGKDIIEHLTGVDIYGPIVDPIVDFLVPGSSGGVDGGSGTDGSDGSALLDGWGNAIMENDLIIGNAIMEMLWVVIAAICVLAVIVWISRPKSHRRY